MPGSPRAFSVNGHAAWVLCPVCPARVRVCDRRPGLGLAQPLARAEFAEEQTLFLSFYLHTYPYLIALRYAYGWEGGGPWIRFRMTVSSMVSGRVTITVMAMVRWDSSWLANVLRRPAGAGLGRPAAGAWRTGEDVEMWRPAASGHSHAHGKRRLASLQTSLRTGQSSSQQYCTSRTLNERRRSTDAEPDSVTRSSSKLASGSGACTVRVISWGASRDRIAPVAASHAPFRLFDQQFPQTNIGRLGISYFRTHYLGLLQGLETMPPASEDEFDDLQDAFGDVDWNAVPGLADSAASSSADRIPPIREKTEEPEPTAPIPPATHASTPSSPYSFDDLDDTFLAEVDALEHKLTQEGPSMPEPGPSSLESSAYTPSSSQMNPALLPAASTLPLTGPESEIKSPAASPRAARESLAAGPKTPSRKGSPRKRLRTESVTPTQRTPSKKQKGKQKESPSAGVRRVLNDFEEDMTCPICCDIFAVAHLGNPCGHTYCGDCGWQWIKKNRKTPTCAICRTNLSPQAPMIPNFSMDNTIERHLQALAASGDKDWQEGGSKLVEWEHRKAKWKAEAASRVAGSASAPKVVVTVPRTRAPRLLDRDLSGSFIVPDDEDDEDYSESSNDVEGEGEGPVAPGPAPAMANATTSAVSTAAGSGSTVTAPAASSARRRTRTRWNRNGNVTGNGNGGTARGGRGSRGGRGGRGWRGRGRGNQARGGAG
ncbi:hypothetical protein EVG20_g5651 [Dentipellis fragilis]|uniref:RING-type domain-containing protein n=1 Tax=Dentipellis fragilis TaxID=205917 RepID=A0A4Y9YU64_9AGAM|nr:hypothetical protein EVG20_g5651 [Dentipellis fragilis]